jgi:hypothetical protein
MIQQIRWNDYITLRSRDSVVSIATGYGLDNQRGWSSSPRRVKNFLFSMLSRPAPGPSEPPIQWVPWALSPGVERPGCEADHSPQASAKVKKMWIYTSTPPNTFIAFTLLHNAQRKSVIRTARLHLKFRVWAYSFYKDYLRSNYMDISIKCLPYSKLQISIGHIGLPSLPTCQLRN